jgi:formate dehydrogenase subunit delta
MDTHHLLVMANRIGEFFAAMPDRAEALNGVFQHLRGFWAPVMRRQLLDLGQAGSGVDARLHPLVAEVLARRGDELRP